MNKTYFKQPSHSIIPSTDSSLDYSHPDFLSRYLVNGTSKKTSFRLLRNTDHSKVNSFHERSQSDNLKGLKTVYRPNLQLVKNSSELKISHKEHEILSSQRMNNLVSLP